MYHMIVWVCQDSGLRASLGVSLFVETEAECSANGRQASRTPFPPSSHACTAPLCGRRHTHRWPFVFGDGARVESTTLPTWLFAILKTHSLSYQPKLFIKKTARILHLP